MVIHKYNTQRAAFHHSSTCSLQFVIFLNGLRFSAHFPLKTPLLTRQVQEERADPAFIFRFYGLRQPVDWWSHVVEIHHAFHVSSSSLLELTHH